MQANCFKLEIYFAIEYVSLKFEPYDFIELGLSLLPFLSGSFAFLWHCFFRWGWRVEHFFNEFRIGTNVKKLFISSLILINQVFLKK